MLFLLVFMNLMICKLCTKLMIRIAIDGRRGHWSRDLDAMMAFQTNTGFYIDSQAIPIMRTVPTVSQCCPVLLETAQPWLPCTNSRTVHSILCGDIFCVTHNCQNGGHFIAPPISTRLSIRPRSGPKVMFFVVSISYPVP